MHTIPIWSPKLCVRHAELDAQHIMLLELGREVVRTFEGSTNSPEPLLGLLRDIAVMTRRHHEIEELVLEHNCCPSLPEIVFAHLSARATLDDLINNLTLQAAESSTLGLQISEWMHTHIYDTDMPVRDFLRFPG